MEHWHILVYIVLTAGFSVISGLLIKRLPEYDRAFGGAWITWLGLIFHAIVCGALVNVLGIESFLSEYRNATIFYWSLCLLYFAGILIVMYGPALIRSLRTLFVRQCLCGAYK